MALIKKNWHAELCILQNKMCCFLIRFYNPNKFVSHTPRLEKGAVRQFRIAVCSQLRQRICCKAVAANKRRFPAALRLRRRSGHRTATAAPSTARELRAAGSSSRAYLRHPRLPRTWWPCSRLRADGRASAGAALRPPALPALALPTAPSPACRGLARHGCCPCRSSEGTDPRLSSPSPRAHCSTSICIFLSLPGPDSWSAESEERITADAFFFLMETYVQSSCLNPRRDARGFEYTNASMPVLQSQRWTGAPDMAGAALQPKAKAGWAAGKHPWGPTSTFPIPGASPTGEQATAGKRPPYYWSAGNPPSPRTEHPLEQGMAEQPPLCSGTALHAFPPPKSPHVPPVFHHLSCETGHEVLLPNHPHSHRSRRTGRLPAGGPEEISPPLQKSCLQQAGASPSNPRGGRPPLCAGRTADSRFFQASFAKPQTRTKLPAERVSSTARHAGLPHRRDGASQNSVIFCKNTREGLTT